MTHTPIRLYPATILLCSFVGSIVSPAYGWMSTLPYNQEVFLTAYYSPEPDQCCYIQGSYEDEIIMNGKGTHGADGTAVYPGMLAAPKEIPFGTIISLPGIGVGTVHDRGGWITMMEQENQESVAHIDIWVGRGEEGLARALAFGTRRMTATVYPEGSNSPEELLAIERLEAPRSALSIAMTKNPTSLLLAASVEGDQSTSVLLLQKALATLRYTNGLSTGQFDAETKAAVAAFQKDYGIHGDGSSADDVTRARLMAAVALDKKTPPAFSDLAMGSTGEAVRKAQGTLRFLGDYKGRTTGTFDERTRDAVIAFQLRTQVIHDAITSGAGRIGPKTRLAIEKAWRVKRAKGDASSIFLTMQVTKIVLAKHLPSSNLARGSSGDDVKRLQRLLVRRGFLAAADINGTYGQKTEDAVTKLQLQEKIIAAQTETGAGVVGPQTRKSLEEFAVRDSLSLVRQKGLAVL